MRWPILVCTILTMLPTLVCVCAWSLQATIRDMPDRLLQSSDNGVETEGGEETFHNGPALVQVLIMHPLRNGG